MGVSRRDFEATVRIVWRTAGLDSEESWLRTSHILHGVSLVSSGRVREDAALLADLAIERACMARLASMHRKAA